MSDLTATAVLDEPETEDPEDPLRDMPWREADEDTLAGYLQDKIDRHQEFVRTSRYYQWCRTSWSFYYQLAFDTEAVPDTIGVIPMGDEGELVGAQINHMRNLIRHLFNLITKDRPALTTRAVNSDLKSRRQADLGQGLMEYYDRHEGAEEYMVTPVEHALVVAEGFCLQEWDPMDGPAVDADERTVSTVHMGDIALSNPMTWNVIRDFGVRKWRAHQWLGVRMSLNKWRLIAEYPEHREDILAAEAWVDVPVEEGERAFDENSAMADTDEVEVFKFWHLKTLAMPEGRYVLMCGGKILQDTAMPYPDLPLYRVSPGEIMMTPFGYTPAFDLVGIQQLINMCVSTIASNIEGYGVQSIWKKLGSHLKTTQILGGKTLVESEEEPKPLEFPQTPAEVFAFLESLIRHAELVAGVDSITRGAPDEHVRSGAYAALLQAQSVQFVSHLVRSWVLLLEAVGTARLRLLRDFAQHQRIVTIIGKHNRIYQKHFTGDDLELIDRVAVEVTNPIMNTVSGKLQFAEMLVKTGFIKTPEAILEVFETGNVEQMTQSDTAQFSAIAEENEMLLDGMEIQPPLPEDHHVLHLKEHASLFGTRETRSDPELRKNYMAHVMEHLTMLVGNPMVGTLQTVMGYEALPAPGMAAMPPPGAAAPEMPGGAGLEVTAAPTPMDPELDGRSIAQMPLPAEPPGMIAA